MRATTQLRNMLNAPGIIVAPGAYDGISARLIERHGFKAVYMTGAGTAASGVGCLFDLWQLERIAKQDHVVGRG